MNDKCPACASRTGLVMPAAGEERYTRLQLCEAHGREMTIRTLRQAIEWVERHDAAVGPNTTAYVDNLRALLALEEERVAK